MGKKIKIGVVGCGAIGSSLAKTITMDFRKQAVLSGIYDIDEAKTRKLSMRIGKKNISAASLNALIKKSDLIIEASSGSASWGIASQALKSGKDIMIMSVGGIISHYKELLELAGRKKCRVFIPSGAISGVDALKAARIAGIKEVTLTTTKNSASFKGVRYIADRGIDLKSIKGSRLIFQGAAAEAVKYFPQNINVAAVLSIAGIGQDKTRVRIIASSEVKRNIHEIKIVSQSGVIYTRTENVLHPDNPKTSYLAYLSAVAVLKQILGPVHIGT